jgi:hypothetical protein
MKNIRLFVTALLRIGLVFVAALSEAVSRKFTEISARLKCVFRNRRSDGSGRDNDCGRLNQLPHAK